MKFCMNMMPLEDTPITTHHNFVHSKTIWQPHELIPLILILVPCIIDYVETNQLNALKLYTSLRWLLHVSAKQCHPQGATIFLTEPLQRQYGRRQFIGQWRNLHTGMLYSTPVCWFCHMSCDLSPTILTLKWLRKEHGRSLRMALFCRNMKEPS
jgi:hypothetical protein